MTDITFVLTGFGKFAGVENNPAEAIATSMEKYLADHQSKLSIETRAVAIDAKSIRLAILELIQKPKVLEANRVVFLHLGTLLESGFKIEKRAFNCAVDVPDARPPDVVVKDMEKNAVLESSLDVEALVSKMNGCSETVASYDTGRYVLNYLYFYSLYQVGLDLENSTSLFLNVPTFDKVPQDRQMDYVKTLMETIGEELQKE